MFQKVGLNDVALPIHTYYKGNAQLVMKQGWAPLGEFIGAYWKNIGTFATGKGKDDWTVVDPYMHQRTKNAIFQLVGWELGVIAANYLYSLIFGVKKGPYGHWSWLVVPGGPVLQNATNTAVSIKNAIELKRGWVNKSLAVSNDVMELFVPLWMQANKIGTAITGKEWFSIPNDMKRAHEEAMKNPSDKNRRYDPRRWTDRDIFQLSQYIAGGSWSAKKKDILYEYAEYLDESDPAKREKLAEGLEEMLRRYPVRTNRKDLPRTIESLETSDSKKNIIPGLNKLHLGTSVISEDGYLIEQDLEDTIKSGKIPSATGEKIARMRTKSDKAHMIRLARKYLSNENFKKLMKDIRKAGIDIRKESRKRKIENRKKRIEERKNKTI